MHLCWLLYYFNLAHCCDTPILEALWLTLDRVSAELDRILSRLKLQLAIWDFIFHPWDLTWIIGSSSSPSGRLCSFKIEYTSSGTETVLSKTGVKFSLGRGVWYKSFTFDIAYPSNHYTSWDSTDQLLTVYPNRISWYYALVTFLNPVVLELE
jgi:hypothetical protein